MIRVPTSTDIQETLRSRPVWYLYGCFVAVLCGSVTFLSALLFVPAADVPITTAELIQLFVNDLSWLTVAVLVLATLGYATAPLPDRAPDASGALVHRLAIVSIGIVAAGLIGLIISLITFDGVSLIRYSLFVVLTFTLVAVYTALGVTFAVTTSSARRALLFAVAVFFLLTYLWDTGTPSTILVLMTAGDPAASLADPPGWATFVDIVSPNVAYRTLGLSIADTTADGETLAAIVVLVGWFVTAVGLTLRFQQSE